MTTSNFALIGVAGYIAPRHLQAIKDTGNKLVCALDPYDGVGIMDSYFPEADFFTEPERFDRELDKLRRLNQKKVDYVLFSGLKACPFFSMLITSYICFVC